MKLKEAFAQNADSPRLAYITIRGRERIAMRTHGGTRIIRSYTDPTVVRRLTLEESWSQEWQPQSAISA